MKNVKGLALTTATIAMMSSHTFAADRSELHATDAQFLQFNAMYSIGEKPEDTSAGNQHHYLEMEFGGRSGALNLYGYVDVFNLTTQTTSNGDKNPNTNQSKLFMKLEPRFSLDALTGADLSFGPVKEVYLSTLFNWGGLIGDTGTNSSFWGLGADLNLPWLDRSSANIYGLYDINAKAWNGYQFSFNWFKPFMRFDNGSFLAYQGYLDYQFAGSSTFNGATNAATHGGIMFNGLFWHSDRFSAGYGLKLYNDTYLIKDSDALATTGASHYFVASYKF